MGGEGEGRKREKRSSHLFLDEFGFFDACDYVVILFRKLWSIMNVGSDDKVEPCSLIS